MEFESGTGSAERDMGGEASERKEGGRKEGNNVGAQGGTGEGRSLEKDWKQRQDGEREDERAGDKVDCGGEGNDQNLASLRSGAFDLPGATVDFLQDEAEFGAAAAYLAEVFMAGETMSSALKAADPDRFEPAMHELCKDMVCDMAPHGLSPIVKGPDDQILGFMLVEPLGPPQPDAMSEPMQAISKVLEDLQAWERYKQWRAKEGGQQKPLHIMMVATHLKGRRVAEKLLRLVESQARPLGYTDMVAEATSHSQRVFAKLGFLTLAEAPYAAYPQLKDITSPPSAKLMVARIPLPE